MVRRHNKRVHNGKDRHTGRKIPNRSEHDKKVTTRSVGSGRGFVPITLQRRPSTVRCNCTGDEMDKVNERLFKTLQKFTPEGTWNGLTGFGSARLVRFLRILRGSTEPTCTTSVLLQG